MLSGGAPDQRVIGWDSAAPLDCRGPPRPREEVDFRGAVGLQEPIANDFGTRGSSAVRAAPPQSIGWDSNLPPQRRLGSNPDHATPRSTLFSRASDRLSA